jgi:YD repeat-containing protein
MKDFYWNDGATPRVDFGYDAASRLTSVNNANASISRNYYNDNLLYTETEQILLSGGSTKTVTYTYDADGNRSSTQRLRSCTLITRLRSRRRHSKTGTPASASATWNTQNYRHSRRASATS